MTAVLVLFFIVGGLIAFAGIWQLRGRILRNPFGEPVDPGWFKDLLRLLFVNRFGVSNPTAQAVSLILGGIAVLGIAALLAFWHN